MRKKIVAILAIYILTNIISAVAQDQQVIALGWQFSSTGVGACLSSSLMTLGIKGYLDPPAPYLVHRRAEDGSMMPSMYIQGSFTVITNSPYCYKGQAYWEITADTQPSLQNIWVVNIGQFKVQDNPIIPTPPTPQLTEETTSPSIGYLVVSAEDYQNIIQNSLTLEQLQELYPTLPNQSFALYNPDTQEITGYYVATPEGSPVFLTPPVNGAGSVLLPGQNNPVEIEITRVDPQFQFNNGILQPADIYQINPQQLGNLNLEGLNQRSYEFAIPQR